MSKKDLKQDENKSVSAVDEFNRNKRIYKKFKFKSKDVDYIWKCFLVAFKKTFKVQRDLELNLKFTTKIGGIVSHYEIETFDEQKHKLQIKWENENDKYWLKFYIRKKYLGFGSVIRFTEHIFRSTPFWGLQDTAGLMWMKKNFKNEMKKFKTSIDLVMNNNGEIPENVYVHNLTKSFTSKFKLKENNVDYLINVLKKYFKTTRDIKNATLFTSKINKSSIIYNIKVNENVIIDWTINNDKFTLIFDVEDDSFSVNQTIKTIEDNKTKMKMKLLKKDFNEFIKDLKNIVL